MRSEQRSRALSKHPRIAKRLRWIEKNWPAVGQVTGLPKRLVQSIDECGERGGNRDGRGTTVETIDRIERTLKHVKSAVMRVAGDDGSIARKARQLLKSLQHIHDFDVSEEKAREFFGEVQKAGKRNANNRAVCDAGEHVFGPIHGVGRVRLRRVVSVAELRKVGRTLELCVAHASEVGRPYHAELRSGETEFWTLGLASAPIALLSVEENDGVRYVTEFQGENGGRPVLTDRNERRRRLPGWLLRNVLRRLKADASDQAYFSCEGAFRSLLPLSARQNYRDVVVDGRYYRVWRFPEEVIVASSAKPPKGDVPGRRAEWSRFVRRPMRTGRGVSERSVTRYEWREEAWHDEAMDFGALVGLLEESPEMYDAFVGRK